MSKIAKYLNEHLTGEVSGLASLRERYATDGSILSAKPELIAYPRTTNDIRKIARFSWQLAEKGHVMGLTARGMGGDTTGAAIGHGVIIDTTKYLNEILYVSSKDKRKIVHVQPGVSMNALQQTLKWQGLTIGGYKGTVGDMTVGGAIAGGFVGAAGGKYGGVGSRVERMEVVLASGDVMEVSRISKRDLGRKKGEQTFEGEIYRRIDGIIEDNRETIETLGGRRDLMGYRIDRVKQKDGSFDLAPLFIGSQGTLGIISEAVLSTDFYSSEESALVALFETPEAARDAAYLLEETDPTMLQIIDGLYYDMARAQGKRFLGEDKQDGAFGAAVYLSVDDFGDAVRKRKLKKALKLLEKQAPQTIISSETVSLESLWAFRDVEESVALPSRVDETVLRVANGAYVPRSRYEEFVKSVAQLADELHVRLPLKLDVRAELVSAHAQLDLKRLPDRQKALKLSVKFAEIVANVGGAMAARTAEGRLDAFAGYPSLDPAVKKLYEDIRDAFDPFKTLNPGVKHADTAHNIARQIRAA